MKKTIRGRAISAAAMCALVAGTFGTAQAAELVTFSLPNVYGTVDGTVTGTFQLPDVCYTGCTGEAATNFTITSFPSGLHSAHGAAPIDLSFLNNVVNNSVTTGVTGDITGISIILGTSTTFELLELNFGRGGNYVQIDGTDTQYYVTGAGGTSGVTYTHDSAPDAAPEPGTWATLALGLGVLARVRRKG